MNLLLSSYAIEFFPTLFSTEVIASITVIFTQNIFHRNESFISKFPCRIPKKSLFHSSKVERMLISVLINYIFWTNSFKSCKRKQMRVVSLSHIQKCGDANKSPSANVSSPVEMRIPHTHALISRRRRRFFKLRDIWHCWKVNSLNLFTCKNN